MTLRALAGHQAGAALATVVDFGTMIALVSLAGLRPALGTALGAAAGAIANFLVSRRWIFRATHRPVASQAGRYAAVSLGSLLLNTAGMFGLTELRQVPYVLGRLCVAGLVSVLWNFPMHRTVVFGADR